MRLRGGPELRARLRAISQSFKPMGREWADETARLGRATVPVRTGRLQRSIRRRNASMKKATVVAHYSAYFVDAGTKAHEIKPKTARALVFKGRSGIVFTKRVQHPRVAPRPFRDRIAKEALRKTPFIKHVIEAWRSAKYGRLP